MLDGNIFKKKPPMHHAPAAPEIFFLFFTSHEVPLPAVIPAVVEIKR